MMEIMEEKIGIIGFGHMGQAIAHAIISRLGWQVVASDPGSPKNHPYLKDHRNCCKTKLSLLRSNTALLAQVTVLILAVRPLQMEMVLKEINQNINNKSGNTPLLISIAGGVPLKFLMKHVGSHHVIRVMPNLPAQVGRGMSVWMASKKVSAEEKNLVRKILGSFGEAMEVSREDLLNGATAVSGSGPGYVFAFLAGLQEAAEKLGFTEKQARMLALQTILGSSEYAKRSNEDFDTLEKRVQTKGGTTEAAFKILKKTAWQKNLTRAALQAYKRSREL